MFSQNINTPAGSYHVSAEPIEAAIEKEEVVTHLSFHWNERGQARNADFHVVASANTNSVTLYHKGKVHGQVPLEGDPDVELDDTGLDEAFATAEQIAELLSSVDPVIGCLIKGAIGSVVKQTIKCWRATRSDDTIGERTNQAFRCLKQAGWSVAWNFVKRVGMCLVKLGFD